MTMDLNKLRLIIKTAVQNNISDIHLRSEERPCFRNKGELVPVKMEPLSLEDIVEICKIIIKDKRVIENIEDICEHDGSYAVEGVCRVRYNLMRYLGKLGIIFRIIPNKIPNLEDIGVASVVKDIADKRRGLILVTGATGSGKSSTLAAMINHINTTRADHILTIEDPIEFVHKPQKSRITQREIGQDTKDFMIALRSALRQDPDVILIGEMRDAETVGIALKAAETGHVVFGTVHTTNALNTIGRLVSMFPPEEQNNAKLRMADNLTATISQRLVQKSDGKGRVVAHEIMVVGPGIRDCISGKDKMSEVYTYIEKGFKDKTSMTFDQHLTSLYKDGDITIETAKAAATSAENLERNLMFDD